MYDFEELSWANNVLLESIVDDLRSRHPGRVTGPPRFGGWVEVSACGPHAYWSDPALLLSQTCGLPIAAKLGDEVDVVGSFLHAGVPGASGGTYRSVAVTRTGLSVEAALRGRCAVNNADSLSGCASLGAFLATSAQGDTPLRAEPPVGNV